MIDAEEAARLRAKIAEIEGRKANKRSAELAEIDREIAPLRKRLAAIEERMTKPATRADAMTAITLLGCSVAHLGARVDAKGN